MIGPCKKKMPDKNVCFNCDAVTSRELGGTAKFPKKRTIHFCTHENLGEKGTVSFIKGYPYTPKWCPALNINQRKGEKP